MGFIEFRYRDFDCVAEYVNSSDMVVIRYSKTDKYYVTYYMGDNLDVDEAIRYIKDDLKTRKKRYK